MLNTRLLSKEVAKHIEKESKGKITFNFGESKCLEVTVRINDDLAFMMQYKDYNVEVRQILPDLEYCVSYIADTTDGDSVTVTKTFEDEESRAAFVENLNKDCAQFTNKL